ncbi:MAG: hypothetical protein SF123_26655 [Chloroflexota bacterium]|nr:hypothetical protein [Chloroflexota bacterium]
MSDLRVWTLGLDQPYALQIAADARLSETDAAEDQVWEVVPGAGESAALALQTRYGGRAGLASLVPMWVIDRQVIYQAAQYAQPLVIRGFAPAFVQLQTRITPTLALIAEFWAMDSRAVGGRFLLRNLAKEPISLRLDMLAFVGMEGAEQMPKIIPMPGERHALALGAIGDLYPILQLDNGFHTLDAGSSKLSATLSLAAGARAALRFVCAGLPDPRESITLGQHWLTQDWGKHFKRLSVAANAAPRIETGDAALDATIAFGYTQLVQAFIRHERAAHSILLPQRQPSTTANERRWAVQDMALVYPLALAAASVDAGLAQGVVRNFIAAQHEDGSIDGAPRVGDRSTYLCLPMLARLAWSIFQYTEDSTFLREVFPPLLRFFRRWLQPDLDVDGDGAPEWQSTLQMGSSGHNLKIATENVRLIESPSLVAMLLSEATSLHAIAYYLHESTHEQPLKDEIERLKTVLETFWQPSNQRHAYLPRDRDTHRRSHAVTLLNDGIGDEEQFIAATLTPPNRVVVEIVGGLQHTPRLTLHLHGTDEQGSAIHETADESAFHWQTGRGRYTSQAVFASLDRLRAEGLVRVYRLNVRTPIIELEDLDDWLPLWSVGITPQRADEMVNHRNPLHDVTSFYSDLAPFWATTIGEGLIEYNRPTVAVDVLRAQLYAQTNALREKRAFMEWYLNVDGHPFEGVRGHNAGLPPLHLLLRSLGVRVISPTKVWTGGHFAWDKPVKIAHNGVIVERRQDGTRVQFPSGKVVELSSDAPWQEIIDATSSAP